MNKIGLFYGPKGGSVEKVARKLVKLIGEDKVDISPVMDATASDVNEYSNVIFGISTIGSHTWQRETPSKDWDGFLPELDRIDYSNKSIALYGLGDHLTYALHFVDSLGVLGKLLMDKGAKIIGQTSPDDYDFKDSDALINGEFIGLPLDEDYESDKTDERLQNWLDRVLPLFE